MKSFAACSTAASKLAAAVRLGSATSSNGITGGLGGDGDGGGGGGGGEDETAAARDVAESLRRFKSWLDGAHGGADDAEWALDGRVRHFAKRR